MDSLILLTDGSVNTLSKIGYGAYLVVTEQGLSTDLLSELLKVKRFEPTSSTKLELQTLLWALNDLKPLGRKLIIYTDSQNIIGLPGRRLRFEQNNYHSANNKRIANFALYQEFYNLMDQLDFELVKIHGHRTSHQKEPIDRLFTLVDRASRNALREDMQGRGGLNKNPQPM